MIFSIESTHVTFQIVFCRLDYWIRWLNPFDHGFPEPLDIPLVLFQIQRCDLFFVGFDVLDLLDIVLFEVFDSQLDLFYVIGSYLQCAFRFLLMTKVALWAALAK
jgi:hypothetical protein